MKKIMMLLFSTFFYHGLLAQVHSITGIVIDPQNQSIAGVVITLSDVDQTVVSDSLGNFSFDGLKKGRYEMIVKSIGYQFVKKRVDLNKGDLHLHLVLVPVVHLLQTVTIADKLSSIRNKEQSLNVVTVERDFIHRNLGGSLMQTLQRLPGVKTIGIGSGQSKPLIRGLGFNRVVVIDKGVKHEGQQWGADHGLEIDQFAVEEVELLKGAASFTYGSDAIAGAINIKAPLLPAPNTSGGDVNLIGKTNNALYGTSVHLFQRKEAFFVDGRFTYQDYGDYRVPTETLYVYDFAVDLHNNYLRNTAGEEIGFHLNTGWIGHKFKSVFYLSNSYNKSGFFANAHGLEPRRVDANLHDASSRDILMPYQQVNHLKLINKTNFEINQHQIEAEFGYQHNDRKEYNHYVNHGYMPPIYPSTMTIPIDLERLFNKNVYSVNLKDQLNLGQHRLAIGANGEIQNNKISGWSFLVPAFKQQTAGLYIYDKWTVNDKMLLHGALRYDFAQINLSEYTDWFFSETAIGNQKLTRAANLKRNFNSLVWSIGLNYNWQEFELKANIGKSFRVPIAKELGANGVNYHYFSYEKGDPNLNPEQSYQADISIGLKKGLWEITLSPFFNYFPNYIYLNPTAAHDYFYGAGNQIFEYTQSKVMRYGGEVEIKYQLCKNISTAISGEYLYAKQLSGNKKGYGLPFSPPASALFNLTYQPKAVLGLDKPYLSLDYRLTAEQTNIVPPELKTPGYQLFNLQAGTQINMAKQPVSISLQLQNVLNTKYLNHTSFYRLIGLPEQGRNFIISAKVPFNF